MIEITQKTSFLGGNGHGHEEGSAGAGAGGGFGFGGNGELKNVKAVSLRLVWILKNHKNSSKFRVD